MIRQWRAVVLEEEGRGREHIVGLLQADSELSVVAEASWSGIAEQDPEHAPDILILAAESLCGGRAGLPYGAAGHRDGLPEVIFVASDEKHALTAFDLGAADYVLRPVEPARLKEAVGRAKARLRHRELMQTLAWLATRHSEMDAAHPVGDSDAPLADGLKKVLVRARGQTLFVNVEDICYIEAEDYHTRAHTETASYLLRQTLSWFEERLDQRKFVRVHRSFIVNVDRIVSVKPWSGGSYDLQLQGGARVRLSAARKRELEGAIGQAI